jgi:hypothetical protein
MNARRLGKMLCVVGRDLDSAGMRSVCSCHPKVPGNNEESEVGASAIVCSDEMNGRDCVTR